MKSNFSKVFLSPIVLMVLITLSSYPVLAQEGDYFYEDGVQEEPLNDPAIVSPDDHYVIKQKSNNKTTRNTTTSKSTVKARKSTTPAKKITTQKSQEEMVNEENNTVAPPEDAESPLSFNFLYYIIQKFKFSDIVDE